MSYKGNPILNGCFVKEDTYIGCGYDNAPMIFKKEGDAWAFKGTMDDGYNQKTANINGDSIHIGSTVLPKAGLGGSVNHLGSKTGPTSFEKCVRRPPSQWVESVS